MSCLGLVQMSRRWWGSRCACVSLGYGVDAELGLNGHHTRVLQKHIIRLGADVAFSKAQEHLEALLRVKVSKESFRQECHRHGKRMAKWQPKDTLTPKVFSRAPGAVEFTTDAGKVNTLEEGWKDLKIGVFQKRPCADPATPEEWDSREIPAPTAQVAWAAIAPIKKFSKTWRGWGRRLGVKQTRDLHVLGDGASWIWQSVEQVFTGCVQTLDVYHGCQHLAQAGDRLYGECTKESATFLDRGRKLLLKSGWLGICHLVGAEYEKEDTTVRRKALENLMGYFAKHTHRLNYRDQLEKGGAIGSGAVEGWAKTLGLRLKNRGARWRRKNISGMAALICVRNTKQWDSYWAKAA